ncbi:Hypothetical predicted protein [Octopus vulgaris]|uniref:Uncharacterized protein n=1 Tax=Octopus vulgaris TaxID=6645 RepID=A0AA36B8W0_OCTVU|nr:Hypothetical predicted protein [Octopus vulgaris]
MAGSLCGIGAGIFGSSDSVSGANGSCGIGSHIISISGIEFARNFTREEKQPAILTNRQYDTTVYHFVVVVVIVIVVDIIILLVHSTWHRR